VVIAERSSEQEENKMVTRTRLPRKHSSKKKVRLGRIVTKKYTVYKFDELPKESKEKALRQHGDINVDYDWWDADYEQMTDKFRNDFGIEIDPKTISFSAERGREWYLTIGKMWVSDWKKFMSVIKKEANLNTKEMKNIDEGVEISFPEQGRERFNDVSLYPTETCTLTDNEQWALQEKLANWLKTKEGDVLQNLEKSYDYYISDEAIAETFRANDYDFTEDGKIFG